MQQPLMPPITIAMMPSTLLLGLQSAIAIVSGFCMVQLPINWSLKVIACLAIVIATFYFIMRDALLLLPRSWRVIHVDSQGALHLSNQKGEVLQPLLLATTFIHPQLIILNLKASGRLWTRPPVILFGQQTSRHNHRHLRVWLLWWHKQLP